MKYIAVNGPQELGLWVVAGPECGEFFGGIFALENRLYRLIRLGSGIPVSACGGIKNLLAFAGVKTGTAFLAERTLCDQGVQPIRHLVIRPPGVLRQRVRRTFEHMIHGIQTNNIGGAVGGTFGPTYRGAGQRVHQIQP